MKTLRISEDAEQDLLDIWLYIAEDNPEISRRFLARFFKVFTLICQFPMIGPTRSELMDGLRCFPVADYVLFYLPHPNVIEIVRVLHSARDVNSLFDSHDNE
jgi:toxin ParE1/3/4